MSVHQAYFWVLPGDLLDDRHERSLDDIRIHGVLERFAAQVV